MLKRKKKKRESVKEEDLESIFPKDKDKKVITTKIYKRLKKIRPICIQLKIARSEKTKGRILDENGNVLFADISKITFKDNKTLENNKQDIEKELQDRKANNEPFLLETLKTCCTQKRYYRPDSAYEKLKKEISLPPSDVHTDRYLLRGPIPKNRGFTPSLDRFFLEAHDNYRLVLDEEGYNRLFLEESESKFLVCDQVYSRRRQQIELFDILYHGDEKKLFLYHVKDGFGQTTRDACSQLRNAAYAIRGEINSGSYQILRQLYRNATKTQDRPSAFRKSLKDAFTQFTEDQFINLFKGRKREDIVFVYAFVDNGSQERLLYREKKPGYEFGPGDFRYWSGDKEEIVNTLKDKGFLDKYSRLTDQFLRSTVDSFSVEMKGCIKLPKKLYQILQDQTSQFNSVIAKTELLQLRDELENMGFSFKICQIPRTGSFSLIDEKEKVEDVKGEGDHFEYNGKTYLLGEAQSGDSLLRFMLTDKIIASPEPDDDLLNRLQYSKIVREQDSDLVREDLQRILGEINKKRKNPLPPRKTEELNQRYCEYIILGNISLKMAGVMEHISKLRDKKIVLFSQKEDGVVNLASKRELNPKGQQELVVVSQGERCWICQEAENSTDNLSIREHSTIKIVDFKEQLGFLFKETRYRGIENESNDCFLNSSFQLMVHSPLFPFLLNEKNIDTSIPDRKDKQTRLFEGLWRFYGIYKRRNKVHLSLHFFREILGFSQGEEEDAAEVLEKIFHEYKIDEITSIFKYKRRVDLENKIKLEEEGQDIENFSEVDDKGVTESFPEHKLLIKLPISLDSSISFQELINSLFTSRKNEEGIKIIYEGRKYESQILEEQLVIEKLQDDLFFQIKRFQRENDDKIQTPVTIEESLSCRIGDREYELRGFVVHKGEKRTDGHFFTCCRVDEKWLCYNDDKRVSLMEKGDILKNFQDAYIVYLQAKRN